MTDILITKKNIVLDATVFSTLQGCGRLTDFRFNMNLISLTGKSNSLEAGNIVHKFLEVYYKCIIGGQRKDFAINAGLIAAELYARGCQYCTDFVPITENEELISKPKCGHTVNEYPGVKNTPYEAEKPYEVGWKWALQTCEQYVEHYKNDFWVPLEIEVVKSKILYEDDEIRILWKAKLDMVTDTNDGIYSVDHKSMKQRRTTMSLNNQFIGQCLIMGTRKVIINKVGFQKTLKPHEKFERVPISYSAARLIEWQGTTLPYYAYKMIEYNESGYWPPNYDHCENKYGNCPFVEVCETDPNEREHALRQDFMVGPDWNPTNVEEE